MPFPYFRTKLILVCALFFAHHAAAEPGTNPLMLNEENERIMEVTLSDSIKLSSGMIAYSVGQYWFLPIGELAENLGIAVQVSTSFSKAHGFILNESRVFDLELKTCSVKYGNKSEKYNCKLAQVRGDEIFVDSRLIERWFPVKFQIDSFRSLVAITPTEKLPFQARQERARDATLLRTQISNFDPGYPRLETQRDIFDFPLFDQQLQFTRTMSPLGNYNRFQHTTEIGAEILGLESYGYLLGTEKKIEQWQASFARRDPDGNLLGPLHLTEIRLLYLGLPPIPLVTPGKSGRGIMVSTYPLNAPETFTNQTFQGPLSTGWEVELYRNDYLLDRKVSDASGQYAFRNIPLQYGRNQFRLTFYGPRGERRDEYQTYNIDSTIIQPGRHDYRIGFIELPDSTRRLSLQYEQSLFSGMSASAGYLRDDKTTQGFGHLGLNGFVGGFLFHATGAVNQTKGSAVEVGSRTGFGPVTVGLKYDKLFNGYQSELFNPTLSTVGGPLVEDLVEATLAHPIPINPAIGMTWLASNKRYVDHTEERSIRNLLSTNVGPFFINNEFVYTLNQSPSVLGKFNLNVLRFLSLIRLGVEYHFEKFKAAEIELQQRLEDSFSVSLLIRREIIDRTNQGHLLATKLFKEASIGLDLAANGNKTYSAGLLLSYSLNREPPTGGWQLNRGPEVQLGAASVFVFLDKNYNGKWDEGEPGIPNVTVVVNQRDADFVTGTSGTAFVGRLQPFANVDLSLASHSFTDPFMRSIKKGYRVVPRPAKVLEVHFPVAIVGEIEGHVYLEDSQGMRAKRGVKVELLSPKGKVLSTQTTDYEGLYLFENVAPGKFLVRVQGAQLQSLKQTATPASKEITLQEQGSFETGNDFVLR